MRRKDIREWACFAIMIAGFAPLGFLTYSTIQENRHKVTTFEINYSTLKFGNADTVNFVVPPGYRHYRIPELKIFDVYGVGTQGAVYTVAEVNGDIYDAAVGGVIAVPSPKERIRQHLQRQ
jgi:hypothetical protein